MHPEKKKGRMSPEEALQLNELFTKLEQLNLEDLKKERIEAMSPIDQFVEGLKQNKKLARVVKSHEGVGRVPKPKQHYMTRRKKMRDYYHQNAKARRTQEKAELLTTPEGWWVYMSRQWNKKKVAVEMSEQDWLEILWPAIGGQLFVVNRYDVSEPIALQNIYIEDSNTRKILWDGKEWQMRQLGYIV
jgi:hypothetical protein